MAKTVTIQLCEPFEAGGLGNVSQVVLRHPELREYRTIGEPFVYAKTADGSIVQVESTDAIDRYMTALVVEPQGVAILNKLGLADAIRLKDEILGFFQSARKLAEVAPPATTSTPT